MPRLLLLLLLLPGLAHAQTAHEHGHGAGAPAATRPSQAGQAAFAAIQEIVGILEADPATDWRAVNIEALRQHLIDMDTVTLRATVKSDPLEGGTRFTVSGAGPAAGAIRRMVMAHAAAMNGAGGWTFLAIPTRAGAILTVRTPPQDAALLQGLGFLGVMARGMHHQAHHLLIARGMDPHH